MMILVTGATGQLGALVIEKLLKKIPADKIVAVGRNIEKLNGLKSRGVQVRTMDYDNLESVDAAFLGVEKVVLISSSEIGKRFSQHQNVIEVARHKQVKHLVYTSLLKADRAYMSLKDEHVLTEKLIVASKIPYSVLRNSWYLENYESTIQSALAYGVVLGSAGEGRVSAASRSDYASAIIEVITSTNKHQNKIYELAGESSFSLSDLASRVSALSNKPVVYKNIPEEAYQKELLGFGLPEPVASMLANADVGISKGDLFWEGNDLSNLTNEKTLSLDEYISKFLN
jgi:NAD(P)H dehydrogenase (quinone)